MKLLKDSGQLFKESLERRIKGREMRKKQKEEKEIPHYEHGEKPPSLPKVPTNKREMQMHLSGRHQHLFRDPITREEKRQWDKWWKFKGAGYNKSEKNTKPRKSLHQRKKQRK